MAIIDPFDQELPRKPAGGIIDPFDVAVDAVQPARARTRAEVASDAVAQFGVGAGNTVSGLAEQSTSPTDMPSRLPGAAGLIATGLDMARRKVGEWMGSEQATQEGAKTLRDVGGGAADYWRGQLSEPRKREIEEKNARIAEAEKKHGQVGAFARGAYEGITDPENLIEQLPNLAISTLLGRRGGGDLAVMGGAALQGGDVAGQTRDALDKLPIEYFERNGQYQQLLKAGKSKDEARQIVTDQRVRDSYLTGAALSVAANKLTPGGDSLEHILAGEGIRATTGKEIAAAVAKGSLGEATSEAIEEGTGQIASNERVRTINHDQSLWEGAGSAAGQGFGMGLQMGGTANGASGMAAHFGAKDAKPAPAPAATPAQTTLALPNLGAAPIYVFPDGSATSDPEAARRFLETLPAEQRNDAYQQLLNGKWQRRADPKATITFPGAEPEQAADRFADLPEITTGPATAEQRMAGIAQDAEAERAKLRKEAELLKLFQDSKAEADLSRADDQDAVTRASGRDVPLETPMQAAARRAVEQQDAQARAEAEARNRVTLTVPESATMQPAAPEQARPDLAGEFERARAQVEAQKQRELDQLPAESRLPAAEFDAERSDRINSVAGQGEQAPTAMQLAMQRAQSQPGEAAAAPSPAVTPSAADRAMAARLLRTRTGPAGTVTEPAGDINAQAQAYAEGKRGPVFIDSAELPAGAQVPAGMQLVASKFGGAFLANEADAARIADIERTSADKEAAHQQILGYQQSKTEAIAGGNPVAVEAKDAQGNVVKGELVDGNNATAVQAAADAQAGLGQVEVKAPEQAIARRAEGGKKKEKGSAREKMRERWNGLQSGDRVQAGAGTTGTVHFTEDFVSGYVTPDTLEGGKPNPDAGKTNRSAMGTFSVTPGEVRRLEAAPAAPAKPKKVPRGEPKSLLELIRRNGGIATRLASDIAGERTAGKKGYPVGVFREGGMAEDMLAELMQQNGYLSEAEINSADDTSGAGAAMELVRQALAGERVVPIAERERAMADAEEQQYREGIRSAAREAGIRTVARKFSDIEAEVLALRDRAAEAQAEALDDEHRAAYDALLGELRESGVLDEAEIEQLIERNLNAPLRELIDLLADAYNAKIEEINAQLAEARPERDLNEEEYRDAHQREDQATAGETAARGAGEGEADGRGANGDRQNKGDAREGFQLEGQTEQELKDRIAALEAAEKQRQADEKKAEEKRQADAERDSFMLTGSDRAADVMAAQGQGGLFDGTRESRAGQSDDRYAELYGDMMPKQRPVPADVKMRAGTYGGKLAMANDSVALLNPRPSSNIHGFHAGGDRFLSFELFDRPTRTIVGFVELEMRGDAPVALHDIYIADDYRNSGLAADTVGMLLSGSPESSFTVVEVLESARGFWESIGTLVGYDGNGQVSWNQFQEAREASRAKREGVRRADGSDQAQADVRDRAGEVQDASAHRGAEAGDGRPVKESRERAGGAGTKSLADRLRSLKERADTVLGRDSAMVRFAEQLFSSRDGAPISGRYNPRRIIEIALNSADTLGALNHEAFHHAMDAFFTPAQQAVIRAAFAKGGKLAQQVKSELRLDGERNVAEDDAYLDADELSAFGFQYFSAGRLKFGGEVGRVFKALADTLARIRNWLQGAGFNTAEDLFRALDAGQLGPNGSGPKGGARESRAGQGSQGSNPNPNPAPGNNPAPAPSRAPITAVRDRARQSVKWLDSILHPLGTMPEQRQYLVQRYRTLGAIAKWEEIGQRIYDTLKKADAADAKAAYDYLTTRGASAAGITNQEIRAKAIEVKKIIDQVGQALVKRGLIPQESYEEYRDRYLPRMYLRYLLDDGMASRLSMGGGRKPSNLGYTKARKDLPQEVREILMGEVKDPAFLSATGIVRAMRDLFLLHWLEQISANKEWVLPQQLVEWNGQRVTPHWLKEEAAAVREQAGYYDDAAKVRAIDVARQMDEAADQALEAAGKIDPNLLENYKQISDAKRYGRLRGLWVRKEIHDDLMGVASMTPEDMGPIAQIFGYGGLGTKATQLWKGTKVALNPASQVRNFISNMVFLQLSGVPLHRIPKLMIRAANELANGGRHFQAAKKFGITESSFSSQELFRMKKELLDLEERTVGLSAWGKIRKYAGAIMDFAGEKYEKIEELGKIMKLMDAMEREGMSEEDAALEAQKWLFDYSLVPNAVRYARNAPVGAPFMTYWYKALPRLMEVAVEHPQRFLPWIGMWYGLGMLAAAGLGEDDEGMKAIRKSLPEWAREKSHIAILPWRDAEGRVQFADMGYFFPWTIMLETGKAVAHGSAKDTLSSLGMLSGPVLDLTMAVVTGKDRFTGQDIVNEGDPTSTQVGSAIGYLWNMAVPPWMATNGPISKAINLDATDKFGGSKSTAGQAIGQALGFTYKSFDPSLSRAQNLQLMQQDMQEIEARLRKRLQSMGHATDEERQEVIDAYIKHYMERLDEVQQYVQESAPPMR